ncbi:hypothetical protein [Mycobacterium xenopi]|uniref:Uncharacterized protein n=1 Tax=Mycobacterium xenopi TaxID=1789 RepID=A0AAD1H4R6_MYCXE|nr:hypothetical protein [Mycobacterium xenopi]EID09792.1 hypothetical protein MXEN_19870 [Mycobacterium xenopi RIVM700367]MDA3641945.1 hypothetical protein [Mycobacterium xenopi]MDA3659776.1 hypothetical protein [Mycobacterium xenopi]MDA3664084.1 hypothetical protein [Mycobacterium xenopi]ORX13525.1 hypothetical protein AWC32_15325 [Mycobacterium xenopi]
MGSFVVHLASGESMTVDGEFTIGGNGVLTVVRNQHLRPAVTLHFAPTAWISVETAAQPQLAVALDAAESVG